MPSTASPAASAPVAGVSQVDFYHDADDRLAVAARIAHKAHAQGLRAIVLGPAGVLGQFDRLLWTQPPLSFLPHCAAGSPLADATPFILSTTLDGLTPRDLLLHLGDSLPAGFKAFSRIVEVVSKQGDDRPLARERFKQYRAAGCEIKSHQLGGN